jgi:hypothetical protein
MIINSIRNILMGMGTSGMRGGEHSATTVAGPIPTVVQIHLNSPLSYGKWRLKVQPAAGQHITGFTIAGNDAELKNAVLHPPVLGIFTDPGFLVEFCGDICSDLLLVRITCSVLATGIGGHMDFEVWGQTAAPGPGSAH